MLDRHVKSAHTKQTFLCDICNNLFSRKDILLRHLKTAHRPTIAPNTVSDRSGPSLHCNACQLTFSSQRKYDTHMKGHKASPTFPCMQCEKIYSRKYHLIRHNETSHSPKHLCDLCGCQFQNEKKLLHHKRFHPNPEVAEDPGPVNPEEGGHANTEIGEELAPAKVQEEGDDHPNPEIADELATPPPAKKRKEDGSSSNAIDVFTYEDQRLEIGNWICTPTRLSKLSSLLNIQNSDEKCFLWCILASFHYKKYHEPWIVDNYFKFQNTLDVSDIIFPMQINQISK